MRARKAYHEIPFIVGTVALFFWACGSQPVTPSRTRRRRSRARRTQRCSSRRASCRRTAAKVGSRSTRSDIYTARSASNGRRVVERLGPPINTERSEPDVFIDLEQRYMILARTDDPSGLGGDDLFISTRAASGEWSALRNLGRGVNTTEYEYGPLVSADGRTLYFTSHRAGNASLYRIPTATVRIPGNE